MSQSETASSAPSSERATLTPGDATTINDVTVALASAKYLPHAETDEAVIDARAAEIESALLSILEDSGRLSTIDSVSRGLRPVELERIVSQGKALQDLAQEHLSGAARHASAEDGAMFDGLGQQLLELVDEIRHRSS